MEFMNLDALSAALKALFANKEEIISIANELRALKAPPKPDIVESATTWQDYENARNAYFSLKYQLEQKIEGAEDWKKNQNRLIIQALPANTWVKVGDHYIGYSTSDWPMYQPILEILDKTPDRILKHMISNIN